MSDKIPVTETLPEGVPISELNMAARYKGMSKASRIRAAIKLIDVDGLSQVQAAKKVGVDRSYLNRAIQKLKLSDAEKAQRVAAERERKLKDLEQRTALREAQRTLKEEGGANLDLPRPIPSSEDLEPDEYGMVIPTGFINEIRRVPPVGDFVRKYFNGMVCWDCEREHVLAPFHDEILEATTELKRGARTLINVPPGHAKSTYCTVFGSIYEIVRNPNIMIGIVSRTEALSAKFLRLIGEYLSESHMYSHANLIDDYGPFFDGTPGTRTQKHLLVRGRESREKDYTLEAMGITQHIQGTRLHKIICDDIADDTNQGPAAVDKMFLNVTKILNSRVGKAGRMHIVGTRVNPNDIYSRMKPLKKYTQIRYPCIIDPARSLTLWPDHFSYEDALDTMDGMDLQDWDMTYQNSDFSLQSSNFTSEQMERCYDHDRSFKDVPPGVKLVLGVDPAGAGPQSGHTAMVLMGVHLQTKQRYLIDFVNHKSMKAPQIRDQILEYAAVYRNVLSEVRVEINGLQRQLFQYDKELMIGLANQGVRLEPHHTGGNKTDANFGVEAMAPMFHNMGISLPMAQSLDKRKLKDFTDQFIRYPGLPTDIVMATWFAWLGTQDILVRDNTPAFDPRHKVPHRINRRRRVIMPGQGVRMPTQDEIDGKSMYDTARKTVPMNLTPSVEVY